jgi:hypothetical protein
MRYLKYIALLAVLTVPFAYSQAQVRVGIGFGVGPAYVAGPPVCTYGYYNYYPYACAPYGYYGPDYFVDGLFVGIVSGILGRIASYTVSDDVAAVVVKQN